MNSARVAGGAPPAVHWRRPPQSPVAHWPAPVGSKLQAVLPQNRPDQPGGAVIWREEPGGKVNPPSPIGAPLPVSVAGHTV